MHKECGHGVRTSLTLRRIVLRMALARVIVSSHGVIMLTVITGTSLQYT